MWYLHGFSCQITTDVALFVASMPQGAAQDSVRLQRKPVEDFHAMALLHVRHGHQGMPRSLRVRREKKALFSEELVTSACNRCVRELAEGGGS